MTNSSDIRLALQGVRCAVLYRLEWITDAKGFPKLNKIPTHPITGYDQNPHDPAAWMTPEETQVWSESWGPSYGVAIVISEQTILPNGRKLFCLDLDKCRDGDRWLPHATAFLAMLPGAGVEVSVSGNGLHAWGTYSGERPVHGVKNSTYRLELYTRLRFIATGHSGIGDPLMDCTRQLHALARDYFPPHDDTEYGDTLTSEPVEEWSGPEDDDELIRRAMASRGARQIWGGRASFADLFTANEPVLARVFPPQQHGTYNASDVDLALANHLAFWTGCHGERMERIMRRSALVRDKWDARANYLLDTIQKACGSQHEWYNDSRKDDGGAEPTPSVLPAASIGPATGAPLSLQPQPMSVTSAPGSPIRPGVTNTPGFSEPLIAVQGGTAPQPRPSFDLGAYLTTRDQLQLFNGCTYIQDIHQVLMPLGHTLTAERFNAEFAGWSFAMEGDGSAPTTQAWDAFVYSRVQKFPKVKGLFFDPRLPPKTVIQRDEGPVINSYVPSIIVRRSGDVSPFLSHLYKLLPNGNDAQILLAYFAACVQHAGEKFQWWPLIQGVEGNGKTTLSYLLEYAVGERYTHWPKAAELGSRFNSTFYGKLLVCVEDVKITEQKGTLWESLKPMVTAVKLEIEGKGVDKITREVCFNGVMNSNHKDAIRKTKNDRRIGPFFTAQQSKDDLRRDGLDEDYMIRLRSWRMGEGREIVADYLYRYEIPDALNPATRCSRCPDTSSTGEAIRAGLGVAEQEVLEAINAGQLGFRGGWISSSALDRLLGAIGKQNAIPRNKRRELLESLGYSPHMGLPEGRSTREDTDGSRPYLFVMAGTAGAQERDAARVFDWYRAAQG